MGSAFRGHARQEAVGHDTRRVFRWKLAAQHGHASFEDLLGLVESRKIEEYVGHVQEADRRVAGFRLANRLVELQSLDVGWICLHGVEPSGKGLERLARGGVRPAQQPA